VKQGEIRAVGELAGDTLGGGGALARDMHEAIAGRTFGALGPLGAPVRVVHDGIAGAVHRGIGAGMRALPRGGAYVFALRARDDAPPLAATAPGGLALGVLNGAIGDALAATGSPLALDMAVRRGGADVPTTPAALAFAFPAATPKVAVFVHGLSETEDAWRVPPLRRGRPRLPSYGERLNEDLGFTAVELRYNTGLHISHNGRRLARLLDELVGAWPVAIDEMALVGHSMGGLVARSACHYGQADGYTWTRAVRHVFCLGSPHLGAYLEKAINASGWALGRLPETRAFAKIINRRSVGIKDLRYGACVDEDWRDCDPDEFLRDRCNEVPFLPEANYYFVAARSSDGPLGSMLGDLFVRIPSASGRVNGRGRCIPFGADNGRELGGLTHFDLLNHPAVYEQLRAWIARAPN
jgi:pimeloyl-ACP methyl ester carboxylesterase